MPHKKKRLATFGAGGFALLREIDVTWCLCLFTPSPNIWCPKPLTKPFFCGTVVLCPVTWLDPRSGSDEKSGLVKISKVPV